MSAAAPARTAWPLDRPRTDYVLGHVRAVLPDRVIDDAWVAVRDGRIAEVGSQPGGCVADVDGGGLYCLPGLVDVHSDGLERERLPRPGAELPWPFAMRSFEGKLWAAGVTTVFHGASFEQGASPVSPRAIASTRELCRQVEGRGSAPVDHRILHRLDVRCRDGLAALRERLAGFTGPALVSHEDHTPGQGQYADRTYYERYVSGTRGLTDAEARLHVDDMIARRDTMLDVRAEAFDFLSGRARTGAVRLFGHDPASPAEIAALAERGGVVAEFPTTVAAARAARASAMPVVMGAPNALRGTSHAGNASARELVGRGLVTALASDYLPSGLLAAAFLLASEALVDLPAAVRLVTAGGAQAAGLDDRGMLAPGLRADLVLAEAGRPWPTVCAVMRAESPPARRGASPLEPTPGPRS
ncbi:alpha-D-ribose 1-methylphosphonate 5-triphosphate diphosphatase [Pseudonocardia parietis]|uniref:Alpha-D-ribose 1-methylphosphonate 5-triphosphate diphosphatase n=1 Tax=Pseudonocardia parietis TaxID=570936 RepID=A0ABS4W6H8_9PSEU|nr:alpha-D-ribose 1-methylphosphonate 5-triphosphate diphosphatase [Pseudonocardia parietis]MBP2371805.1 alpha-D-ribose 1-methylphosphonate 5-triphosphate diphosphatase [Pseudonocardia parietis]